MRFPINSISYSKIISILFSISILLVSTQLFSEEPNKRFNITSQAFSIQEDIQTMHQVSITPDENGDMNIAFYLDKPSEVEIQIKNNNGIVVETFEETSLTSGKHVISVSSILKGIFILQLTIDGKILFSKINLL